MSAYDWRARQTLSRVVRLPLMIFAFAGPREVLPQGARTVWAPANNGAHISGGMGGQEGRHLGPGAGRPRRPNPSRHSTTPGAAGATGVGCGWVGGRAAAG